MVALYGTNRCQAVRVSLFIHMFEGSVIKGYPKKRTALQKYLFFQNFTYLGLTVWYSSLVFKTTCKKIGRKLLPDRLP